MQNYPAVTVTATDANSVVATSSAFSWTIGATIVLTTSAQASVVNVALNPALQLSATGGAGSPYTYSLVGTTLPSGLSLSSAGLVTGTPTAVGTYTVQVKVFDKGGKSFGTGSFTWTIGYPPLVASSPGNQVSTLNTAISPQVQLTASGGSGNYAWSGTLPAGLSLSTGGLIAGTPTATGTSAVTLTVRDTTTGNTQTVSFSWAIVAKPTITAPAAQTDTIGDVVSLALASTCPNSPCTFASTTLPTGLSVNSSGLISGTVAGTVRTYATTVTITDADGASVTSASFNWTVFAKPTITTPADQTDTIGSTVTLAVTNTCTNTPCSFTMTGAPSGLSISATTGVISGTVTGAAQTYSNVVVTVTDADGASASTAAFIWTIVISPSVTAPANQSDTTGTTVNLALTKTCPNAPCSYTLNNGPGGLSITSAGVITGIISGTAGTYTPVTITITDSDGLSATSTSFSWQVFARPTVTAPAAQTDTIGDVVSLALAKTCANAPCTFALANAPTGLSISNSGVITGTVAAPAQTYSNVLVTITDADSATASASFVWTVFAKPTITAPANQTDTVGGPVSVTLTKSCPNSPCTYTLNNGPTGLSVTAAGVITGTVGGSAPQTYSTVSVTVTDADGATATTSNFTWQVFAKPTITAPVAQTDTIGDTVSLALTKTCTNAPCTYTLNNGPTGLSISSAGVITGTVGGSATTYSAVSVTVTDSDTSSATSATFTWTVFAKPTITAPANQTNLIGEAVSLTLTKSCTNAPCAYVLNSGPSGLSVTSAGVVTGTVTGTAQVYSSVSVSVTDADGATATSATFTWTIQAAITLTTGPQAATTSDSVNVTLAATGGAGAPYTYSVVSNSLPAGLTLSSAGVVTGTPTTPGTYTTQVKIFDKSGTHFGTGSFTWTITYPPLAASNPGNQTATLNTALSPQIQLSASGGSGNYAWTGTLPAGITLTTGGLISGTPTATGSTAVTLTVRDTTTGSTKAISFTFAVVAKPTITAPATQTSSVGSSVSLQLTTTCPNSPCTYAFNTKAPSGLTISSTGLITGTITSAAGSYTLITVTVTDNDGAVVTSGTFTWTVNSGPTITSPGNQTSSRGDVVSLDMSTLASGGTPAYTYSATGLPTWLHISATTGKITGTAPNANSTTTGIKVTITDTKGATATTAAFTWNVTDLAWSVPDTISTPLGTNMSGYQASTYVSGGATGTKTYSAANIPTGLTISSSGAVTGTTSARGTFHVVLTVVDSVGASVSADVTWTVT